jgi:hypothetical protein
MHIGKSPGIDKESNWLPAPDGDFSLWIRAYWPDQAILDGTWTPPRLVRLPADGSAPLKSDVRATTPVAAPWAGS